jgi:putative endonuclease
MSGSDARWILYLIECRRGNDAAGKTAFYTGITTDLQRRFDAHSAGTGARYTRANPPLRIVATREYPDRSAALKAEAAVKKLPRQAKPAFFRTEPAP